MARTSADVLVTDLARRLGHNTDDATVRGDMLRRINTSLQDIVGDYSFLFLATYDSVSLGNGAETAALPETLDAGKALTLGRADGKGKLTYVPPDEWFNHRIDTCDETPPQTEPSAYTIARVGGELTFLFKPGASGGSKSIPLIGQCFVTLLGDANDSFPQLPDGYENTLLLIDAEAEERRINGEADWQLLKDRADAKREALYSGWRTTKEQPMTDREQSETKVAREQLARGK